MIKKYINGRSCGILGLGVSNLPLAKYLCENGIRLTVYDKSEASALGEEAAKLKDEGVKFKVSDKEFSDIEEDVIFRSPGIRPDREGIKTAVRGGAELTSETELFLELTPARTFGITGSDGKTTSTTLTGKFLDAQCKRQKNANTYVGGNIGTPLLTECPHMKKEDNAVLELSSFQLMTMRHGTEHAAITNISPNHLDWHGDMGEYTAAKCNIIGTATRRLVTNAECPATLEIAKKYAGVSDMEMFLFSSRRASFEEFAAVLPERKITAIYVKDGYIVADDGKEAHRVLEASRINVPGKHNVENFMTAIGLTYGCVDMDIYAEVAEGFFGVEHRLEFVRNICGVSYYNSSIDSSPSRTAAALSAMQGRSLVLICGGYDKKIPYAPLAEAICNHGGVRSLVLTGDTGMKIMEEMKNYTSRHGVGSNIDMVYVGDFGDAVRAASEAAREGDAVVLSPASASFDSFKNFAERGNTFKELVCGM